MKTIVLCGGGSAGHVIPNLALIPQLNKYFDNIHYIGGNGIEKEILKSYKNITYHEIPTVKFVRALTLKNLKIPFALIKATKCASKVLREIKPDVVFSKGGYASLPVVLGCGDTPVVAHESDFSMGLANKLIYKKCKVMCFSFQQPCKKYKKGIYTGTPIREQIKYGNKANLMLNFNKRTTILFVGGSLGAKALNDFVEQNFAALIKKYNIIHIAGKNYEKKLGDKNYVCYNYITNIEDCFDAADIIISRAGSNAIFEFLTISKPMILVPLPRDVSRGDQILNAKEFEAKGLASVVEQDNLTLQNIDHAIENIINNKEKILKRMKNSKINIGNNKIVEIINKYTK